MWLAEIPAVVRETIHDVVADASVSLVNQPSLDFPSLLPFLLVIKRQNWSRTKQVLTLSKSEWPAPKPFINNKLIRLNATFGPIEQLHNWYRSLKLCLWRAVFIHHQQQITPGHTKLKVTQICYQQRSSGERESCFWRLSVHQIHQVEADTWWMRQSEVSPLCQASVTLNPTLLSGHHTVPFQL